MQWVPIIRHRGGTFTDMDVGRRSSKATESGRSQEQVEDQGQTLGYGEGERGRPHL